MDNVMTIMPMSGNGDDARLMLLVAGGTPRAMCGDAMMTTMIDGEQWW